ncbi:hypothetical protein EON79_18395, partial [bacterium]
AGGMTLSQAVLALLPEAESAIDPTHELRGFYRAMSMYLGACDGPAAIVACDGDEAIAHLDRNGLRPLWLVATKDVVAAASELTGDYPTGKVELQRILGPGETVSVKLATGQILINGQVQDEVARLPYPSPARRIKEGEATAIVIDTEGLEVQQRAFGMTKEDLDVVLGPLISTGKPAIGSMGDDTSPSAMLDHLPRRLEDHFSLRFAQETSPPIDPIRDAWVFDPSVSIGDRSGLWDGTGRAAFRYADRVLSVGQAAWLKEREETATLSLLFPISEGEAGLETRLEAIVAEAEATVAHAPVLFLTDLGVDAETGAAPMLRAISRVHSRLVQAGLRHRVGLVAHSGVWDIHHIALLIAMGADAVCPWLGCASAGEHECSYLKGVRSGFVEVMSMMGVTPSAAYCGARLVEAVGLDKEFLAAEFPGVPGHLGGIGAYTLDEEWLSFHREAFVESAALPDAGEFRHSREGRPHANNAEIVRLLQGASGYAKKIHTSPPGSWEAYQDYAKLVHDRKPITLLDCLTLREGEAISLDEVESEESILWRFMAPGMSEGALSEPSHRAIAQGLNIVRRYCQIQALQNGTTLPPGVGPIANSGEGGFDKSRIGRRDGNR